MPLKKGHMGRRAACWFAALAIGIAPAAGANWPSWRGPRNDGTCDERDLPVKWSATENIAWSVELPDRGNSTPVIWGDRVFVTQSIEREGKRLLLCFDKKTGRQIWRSGTTQTDPEQTHPTNPYCSASPATDGQRVIVSFGSAGVFCFDMNGRELWRRDLGRLHHIWGNAASPVLAGDICILNHGPGAVARLVAMDKGTGRVLWSRDEPMRESAKAGREGYYGTWSDPLPAVVGGRAQLFMSWPFRLCSFDVRTGNEIWTCEGLTALVYTSPIQAGGIVVAMGGYGGSAIAAEARGNGDITEKRLWRHPKCPQRIGSGAIHGGHIYILNDAGTAQCIELETGKEIWTERLTGPGPTAHNWSSVVIADGRCYVVNQGGDVFVFRASPRFELLETNPMGEKVIASIAVSDGRLFIRGYKHLFCVGK